VRATRRSCLWETAAAGGEAVPDQAVAPAAGGREAVAEGRPTWVADSRRAGEEVCPLLVETLGKIKCSDTFCSVVWKHQVRPVAAGVEQWPRKKMRTSWMTRTTETMTVRTTGRTTATSRVRTETFRRLLCASSLQVACV
jgi:hypothetical protein